MRQRNKKGLKKKKKKEPQKRVGKFQIYQHIHNGNLKAKEREKCRKNSLRING